MNKHKCIVCDKPLRLQKSMIHDSCYAKYFYDFIDCDDE